MNPTERWEENAGIYGILKESVQRLIREKRTITKPRCDDGTILRGRGGDKL